jgi:hypothetical protein
MYVCLYVCIYVCLVVASSAQAPKPQQVLHKIPRPAMWQSGWKDWGGWSEGDSRSDNRSRGLSDWEWIPDREDRGNPPPTSNSVPPGSDHAAVARTAIWNLEYFQSFRSWTGTYKQHNIALKWFRDSSEQRGQHSVIFDNSVEVPEIVHPKGMQYSFNEEIKNSWTWQEMVAQMDEYSMRLVVEGPEAAADNRSRGLVSCRLQESDRYDHKRHVAGAGADQKVMLKIWDFILVRDDGTQVCVHPNYSNTKFSCTYGVPETDHELPLTGKGGSNGPGTYKYFKNKRVDVGLRFDAGKAPKAQQTQSRSSGA